MTDEEFEKLLKKPASTTPPQTEHVFLIRRAARKQMASAPTPSQKEHSPWIRLPIATAVALIFSAIVVYKLQAPLQSPTPVNPPRTAHQPAAVAAVEAVALSADLTRATRFVIEQLPHLTKLEN